MNLAPTEPNPGQQIHAETLGRAGTDPEEIA